MSSSVLVLVTGRPRSWLLSGLDELDSKGVAWKVGFLGEGLLKPVPGQLPIVSFKNHELGVSASLNLALETTDFDLVSIIADDVVPTKGWLKALLSGAAQWPNCAMFAGPVVPRTELPEHQALLDGLVAAPAFGKFLPQYSAGPMPATIWPSLCNYALRPGLLPRPVFSTKFGWGSESVPLGEAEHLFQRLEGFGQQCAYVPEARVDRIIPTEQMKAKWILRRAFNVGRCSARLSFEGSLHVTPPGGLLSQTWQSHHTETRDARLFSDWIRNRQRGAAKERALLRKEWRCLKTPVTSVVEFFNSSLPKRLAHLSMFAITERFVVEIVAEDIQEGRWTIDLHSMSCTRGTSRPVDLSFTLSRSNLLALLNRKNPIAFLHVLYHTGQLALVGDVERSRFPMNVYLLLGLLNANV